MLLGKWLIVFGLGAIVIGGLLWLGSKLGIPFGQLPGDINVSRTKFSLSIPIVTCIAISILLTLVLNLILWLFRK